MNYQLAFHRFSNAVVDADESIRQEFNELTEVIEETTDERLIETLLKQREQWKINQLEKGSDIKFKTWRAGGWSF